MLASAVALVALVALRTSALQLRVACSAGPVRAFSRQRHVVANQPDSDEADGTWVEGMHEDMRREFAEHGSITVKHTLLTKLAEEHRRGPAPGRNDFFNVKKARI